MNTPIENTGVTSDDYRVEAALLQLRGMDRAARRRTVLACFCIPAGLVAFLCSIVGRHVALPGIAASIILMVVGHIAISHDQNDFISSAVAIRDVRAVGLLLEVLVSSSDRHRKTLHAALTELFLLMRTEDLLGLSPSERQALGATLLLADGSHDTDYILGVLETVQRIGNGSFGNMVQGIAQAYPTGAIHDAAEVCLVTLAEKAQHQVLNDTLLRPGNPSINPVGLLRPASGSIGGDSDQLVRPVTEYQTEDEHEIRHATE